jgi:hypothetical protein
MPDPVILATLAELAVLLSNVEQKQLAGSIR